MTVNERFKALIDEMNYNPTSFSKEIGVSQTAVRHVLDGENLPSAKILIPILDRFPYINANWLLVGKGEMFLRESTELERLKNKVVELERNLADKEEIIKLLKQRRW